MFAAAGGLIYAGVILGATYWHIALIYPTKHKIHEARPTFPPYSLLILINSVIWVLVDIIALIICGIVVAEGSVPGAAAATLPEQGNNGAYVNPGMQDPYYGGGYGNVNYLQARAAGVNRINDPTISHLGSHMAAYGGYLFFITFSALLYILDGVLEVQRYRVSMAAICDWKHGGRAKFAHRPSDIRTAKSISPDPSPRPSLDQVHHEQSSDEPDDNTESYPPSARREYFLRAERINADGTHQNLGQCRAADGPKSGTKPRHHYVEREIEVEVDTHDKDGRPYSNTEAIELAMRKLRAQGHVDVGKYNWKKAKEKPHPGPRYALPPDEETVTEVTPKHNRRAS